MTNLEKIESLSILKKNIQLQYFKSTDYSFDGKTMYFGTGLASVDKPSKGFGIEILGTILTSLWLKRELGLSKVIHEISTIGYNIDEETRGKLIKEEQKIIEKLIKNLSIESDYELFFSHDYHEKKEFKDINDYVNETLSKFDSIPEFEEIKKYTKLQITGMKYLYDKYDTRLKLGWITDKRKPLLEVTDEEVKELIERGHLSEYYFDNMYKYVFPSDDYSFLYTPCALDFVNGNRYVPYTVIENQNRPILDKNNLINYCKEVPDSKTKNKVINNWGSYIVDTYEDLFETIPISNNDKKIETIEKVEFIKKKVLEY